MAGDPTKKWVDLVTGARVRVDLADRLRLSVSGTIDGFDLGSASDFTGSINVLLAYQISPSWQLVGGWRELDVDRGRLTEDIRFSGPLVGAVRRF